MTSSPGVTMPNPRIAYHSSNFAIADVTWNNVPMGRHQHFLRHDTRPAVQYAVTFVGVIPPLPPATQPGRRHRSAELHC